MMNQLIDQNLQKLDDLIHLVSAIPIEAYTQKNELIYGASVGQHFRHIIEFYGCIQNGLNLQTICYDNRDRDLQLEIDPYFAISTLEKLKTFVASIQDDQSITMQANYDTESSNQVNISTSLYREMAYALDHTVHHLAIVKIALNSIGIAVNENLGVAPSTIRHKKQVCVR